ncbi:MAG: DUF2889 domain-containing protein [Peptococcaceae bacterium]|jgi:hypothetical protein|nr:DUF2889 domain-containing protein [Peptococcaceae bacterium]
MDLFSRYQYVHVESIAPKELVVSGNFMDKHHEIHLRLSIALPGLKISEAGGRFVRCPYERCQAAAANLGKLTGLTVGPGVKKKIREALGGCGGCVHLVELAAGMTSAVLQAYFELLFRSKTPEEIEELKRRLLTGSCVGYPGESGARA